MAAGDPDPPPRGSASTLSRKLQSKLDKLDPTERLAIPDWLINFRAAAGSEFAEFFSTVKLGYPTTVDEYCDRNGYNKADYKHDDLDKALNDYQHTVSLLDACRCATGCSTTSFGRRTRS